MKQLAVLQYEKTGSVADMCSSDQCVPLDDILSQIDVARKQAAPDAHTACWNNAGFNAIEVSLLGANRKLPFRPSSSDV